MKLSVQIQIDKKIELESNKANVTVGRSPKSDIVIPHDSISRSHCTIELIKGIFYLTDHGSSNGSFIDGQQVTPEQKTPFLTSSILTLGKVDCEVSDAGTPVEEPKAVAPVKEAPRPSDQTSTVRISQKDLGKIKARPKNPVSSSKSPVKKSNNNRNVYILLFLLVGAIVLALMYEGLS